MTNFLHGHCQWFKRMQYSSTSIQSDSQWSVTLCTEVWTFVLKWPRPHRNAGPSLAFQQTRKVSLNLSFFHDFIDIYFWYLELFPATSTMPNQPEFLREQWDPQQRWALATLSHWPHQVATQRNRNDSPFIIGRPLCLRGKSIIKTRLTAKITAVSSIV